MPPGVATSVWRGTAGSIPPARDTVKLIEGLLEYRHRPMSIEPARADQYILRRLLGLEPATPTWQLRMKDIFARDRAAQEAESSEGKLTQPWQDFPGAIEDVKARFPTP